MMNISFFSKKKYINNNLEWISTTQLVKDSITLAGMIPSSINGIIGVARSGMIPASLISTQLNLPLFSINEDGEFYNLGCGNRNKNYFNDFDNLFVVDDTVWSGDTLNRIKQKLNNKTLYGSIYINHKMRNIVNFFVKKMTNPPIFLEWNIFNSFTINDIASDLDGIICHDKLSGGLCSTPFLVSKRYKIPYIITGRKEVDREITEEWLKDYNINYDKLIMFPNNLEQNNKNIAEYKGKYFANINSKYFVESDPNQASIIYEISKKPVICPIINKIFQ